MSYNGSGTFNINTAGQPVVTGTVISSSTFNALTADLGTGLSTAITKDGQTVATARIPFAQGINSSLVTDATSTTTGSIITAGGAGIAKALYVGTTLNVTGASTLAGITGTFNGTVGATTPSTGAFTTLSATGITTVAAGSEALPAIVSTTGTADTGLWFPAADTVAASTAGTERLRLDSSGNLGIGTSSPTARLHVSGTGTIRQKLASTTGAVELLLTSDSQANASYSNIYCGDGTNFNWQIGGSNGTSNTMTFATGGTERARITSGGFFKASNTGSYVNSAGSYHEVVTNQQDAFLVYFKNTNATSPYGLEVNFTATPNNATNWFHECSDGAGNRFIARSNGGLANYSANNVNLSDRREKTNFAPATSYLDKICAIPVQTFNYIDQNLEEDDGLTLGVVAQDVQAVAPELVMESNWAKAEDDEPKMRLSIYQTDLQYALMKCIQEQQAIITALTTRITALEAK
jgi:Chaperone of endosialidase